MPEQREFRVEYWEKKVAIRKGQSQEVVTAFVRKEIYSHNLARENPIFLHSIEDITEELPKQVKNT